MNSSFSPKMPSFPSFSKNGLERRPVWEIRQVLSPKESQPCSERNEPIKILILTHNYIRFRGDHAGLFVHILSEGLQKRGHKVFILAPHQDKVKAKEILDGVEIHRFRYAFPKMEKLAYRGNMHELVAQSWVSKFVFLSFLFSFIFGAVFLVSKKKVDLICAQWWIPGGLIGYLVSLLTKKPLIVTAHGTDIRILEKSKIFSNLASLVFKRAKYITTVSSFLKKNLTNRVKLDVEKVKVIPMPVTPKTFNPSPLPEEKKKKILCVARFTQQKGLEFLIRACKILKNKGIDFEADIVGEGPLKDQLQEEINSLNLGDQVSLVKIMPQENLNQLYAESYLCVLPSIDEGFGLVLVEAQLCKRPVIGTKSGGIPDIIEDGVTGLLVPPRDHLSLASAMEKILTDEKLASQLAEEGYKSAIAKFSPEVVLQKYLEVLA
jgi:glycosyltransferase involved in cell wall biosynthesis